MKEKKEFTRPKNMKNNIGARLMSMPDVAQRRNGVFFRLLAPMLKAAPDNDYHWIFHETIRASFLVAAIPGIFTAVKLSRIAPLTPEIVNNALRTMSLVTAAPILLLIVPFYILKTIRVVGFSKIDFKRPFPIRKTFKAPDWWYDRKKLVKRQFFTLILLALCLIAQWVSLRVFLQHFGVFTDIQWIYFFIFLSCFFYSGLCSGALLFLSMICLQYKYHYHEITHLLTQEHQGE